MINVYNHTNEIFTLISSPIYSRYVYHVHVSLHNIRLFLWVNIQDDNFWLIMHQISFHFLWLVVYWKILQMISRYICEIFNSNPFVWCIDNCRQRHNHIVIYVWCNTRIATAWLSYGANTFKPLPLNKYFRGKILHCTHVRY